MFNLKNLFGKGDSKESPSSTSEPKKLKQKTKETAQNLVKVINDDSLETFSKTASDVEILGAVYKMMVKTYSDDKLHDELVQNQHEQREILAEKRHKEIIQALSSLSFGAGKETKVEKEEEDEDEEEKPSKSTKRSKIPKGVKKTPKKVPKITKTMPEKVGSSPAIPAVGTGVGAAAVGIGLLGSVSAQMAKAETTIQPYTQANIVAGTNLEEHKIIKGNKDVTTGRTFDKNLTEMSIGEVVDLANRRRKYYGGRGGSAMGRYQFIPGTLEQQAVKAFGAEWKSIPFNETNQDILNGQFIKSNANMLEAGGVPVSTASLYLMHFLGSVEKTKAILQSYPETPMRNFMSASEQKMNPSVANMSVGKYREHLKSKGYSYQPIDNKSLQSEPLRPAASINTSSLENRQLNESLTAPIVAETTINQNNFNMFQPQQSRAQQQKNMDDRSAYERKSRTA